MKRLFQLTFANGKPFTLTGTIPYWETKRQAKTVRDNCNQDETFPDKYKPVRVSPGPDHRKYRGK